MVQGVPFILLHTRGRLSFYGELAGELEPDAAAASSAGSSAITKIILASEENSIFFGVYIAYIDYFSGDGDPEP